MTARLSNKAAKASADGAVDQVDLGSTNAQGRLRIYSGTAPALPDDALSGNTLLAELNGSNPFFGAAADANPGGEATAAAISDDPSADATGTASFFRIVDRDGVAQIQGAVGTTGSGAELEFPTVAFVAAAVIQITSLKYKQPES